MINFLASLAEKKSKCQGYKQRNLKSNFVYIFKLDARNYLEEQQNVFK